VEKSCIAQELEHLGSQIDERNAQITVKSARTHTLAKKVLERMGTTESTTLDLMLSDHRHKLADSYSQRNAAWHKTNSANRTSLNGLF
jgi:hypothetical protein